MVFRWWWFSSVCKNNNVIFERTLKIVNKGHVCSANVLHTSDLASTIQQKSIQGQIFPCRPIVVNWKYFLSPPCQMLRSFDKQCLTRPGDDYAQSRMWKKQNMWEDFGCTSWIVEEMSVVPKHETKYCFWEWFIFRVRLRFRVSHEGFLWSYMKFVINWIEDSTHCRQNCPTCLLTLKSSSSSTKTFGMSLDDIDLEHLWFWNRSVHPEVPLDGGLPSVNLVYCYVFYVFVLCDCLSALNSFLSINSYPS